MEKCLIHSSFSCGLLSAGWYESKKNDRGRIVSQVDTARKASGPDIAFRPLLSVSVCIEMVGETKRATAHSQRERIVGIVRASGKSHIHDMIADGSLERQARPR